MKSEQRERCLKTLSSIAKDIGNAHIDSVVEPGASFLRDQMFDLVEEVQKIVRSLPVEQR